MNDPVPLVRTEHLAKTYPDGEVNALIDVSISIPRGQYVAVMGRSGCGKSTLLNLLGGSTGRRRRGLLGGRAALEEPQPGAVPGEEGRLRVSVVPVAADADGGGERASADVRGHPAGGGADEAARELLDIVGLGHRPDHMADEAVGRRTPARGDRAGRWRTSRSPSSPTSRPATSTARPPRTCWPCSTSCTARLKLTFIVVTHSEELAQRAERTIRLQDGLVMQDTMVSGTRSASDEG